MPRIRVGQLAKELGISVAEALAALRKLGADVKTNLSTVEDSMAAKMRAVTPATTAVPTAPARAPKSSTLSSGLATSHRSVSEAPAKPSPRQPLAKQPAVEPSRSGTIPSVKPQSGAGASPPQNAPARPA